ncbi:UPF0187-domain-containing protein [Obba rivulosa]|uniref:UPF0187-domain-containing protein n=1 Tax=Obba rivulosa TaxID=1052685 RepID=A0A8E2ASI6_9APHY|nr:UPF0187-domain-containing protein [Obba rivulosa]
MTLRVHSAHAHPQARSSTGPVLLPASATPPTHSVFIPLVPSRTFISWTFGRATVFWRIWPAVVFHTAFAAAVVSVSLRTDLHLSTPNVMLTLLGVVIGFVIAYRTGSGYDRYWQGRAGWSDVMRTSRTLARLVWIHVPPRLAPFTTDARDPPTPEEIKTLMAEKRVALNLVEGFVVALKHHLRGEVGIYYEDLYHLVKPLHGHTHQHRKHRPEPDGQPGQAAEPDALPSGIHLVTAPPSPPPPAPPRPAANLRIPLIPPINAYGSISLPPSRTPSPFPVPVSAAPYATPTMRPFPAAPARSASSSSTASFTSTSSAGERQPLLPRLVRGEGGLLARVSGDLVPFGALWSTLGCAVGVRSTRGVSGDVEYGHAEARVEDGVLHRWSEHSADAPRMRPGLTHAKHRPRVAGGGSNLPLEIVRSFSVWLSVLEARGSVPGTTLGAMFGCLASFEDSLSALERILTTPLPFVYSAHIKHTVWIYLFFLPFQLVDLFRWYTIPGVCIASFIYLGFLAAGEEIEQPFGYDENDLDLDLFCEEIVHADIERLRRMPCPNIFLGAGDKDKNKDQDIKKGTVRAEDVFGRYM